FSADLYQDKKPFPAIHLPGLRHRLHRRNSTADDADHTDKEYKNSLLPVSGIVYTEEIQPRMTRITRIKNTRTLFRTSPPPIRAIRVIRGLKPGISGFRAELRIAY